VVEPVETTMRVVEPVETTMRVVEPVETTAGRPGWSSLSRPRRRDRVVELVETTVYDRPQAG
jgi:hypothetical protein